MFHAIYQVLVLLLAATVVFTTLAPMSSTHHWWIRGWDFPRVQIAVVAVVVALLALPIGGWLGWGVAAAMLAAALYQGYRIAPFTPLVGEEIRILERRDDDVVCLAINVEMTNDRYGDVARVVRDIDPDVLFLMETDQTWADNLSGILSQYPTVLSEPKDDYYGLIWATRLKTHEAEVVYLTPDDTPSVFAELEDKAGRIFRFVGLHPQPPVPGVDTEERDAQTFYAARFAHKTDIPVVVMGDFNDAAWADTAETFKKVGCYVDVRIGRGLFPSFNARHWWFRCPIDQLYLTTGIALSCFEIGPFVGSDHFPVIARLNFDPDRAAEGLIRRRELSNDDIAEIEAAMEKHRARLIDSVDGGG